VSLDFPASGEALWSLYDATGIRPEYLLPVLYSESSFRPDVVNSLGYTGINQASGQMLSGYGTSSADYATWPASQQISRVVQPEYAGIQNQLGPIRSGVRAYQANFLPATLPIIKTLDGVLAHQGNTNEWGAGDVYDNNRGFDTAGKGTITLNDLAKSVAKSADSAAVRHALQQTYALRPGEVMQDPVYGTDFGAGNLFQVTPQRLVLVGVAGFLGYTLYTGQLQSWWARTLPAIRQRLPRFG
jgi:hypothetical protein